MPFLPKRAEIGSVKLKTRDIILVHKNISNRPREDTKFILLRLTHPTSRIEPGCRIEVCDYSMGSISANLDNVPRL